MRNKITVLILLICIFLLSACVQVIKEESPQKNALAVSSVRDRPINYPTGSTFSVTKNYAPSNLLNAEQTDFIYAQYQQAIVNNIIQQGYKHAEIGASSDFILVNNILVQLT